jgi:hypothetical protein|nr:MAG TPA: hypothetical protein [Caudoviricetes sp.]DAX86119.1 MAG TPA: hypothetical protein [Caudoviricetes sp.]
MEYLKKLLINHNYTGYKKLNVYDRLRSDRVFDSLYSAIKHFEEVNTEIERIKVEDIRSTIDIDLYTINCLDELMIEILHSAIATVNDKFKTYNYREETSKFLPSLSYRLIPTIKCNFADGYAVNQMIIDSIDHFAHMCEEYVGLFESGNNIAIWRQFNELSLYYYQVMKSIYDIKNNKLPTAYSIRIGSYYANLINHMKENLDKNSNLIGNFGPSTVLDIDCF